MPRTKGSDELFRLIHSLNKEEKGYFQKFAKRHTSEGNIYLRLFKEISTQKHFDESGLLKKYRNFSRTKVYLKEMITESMLVYHRNNHPHIQVLNQVQKAHFLLSKGMYAESLQIVEEALRISEKMELFPISRYLARMQVELNLHKFNQPDDVLLMHDNYKEKVERNIEQDLNLFNLELRNLDWFVRSKHGVINFDVDLGDETNMSNHFPVLSSRAEIKREEVMHWYYISREDINELHKITQKQVQLSLKFRDEIDSSYYCIVALDNHILSCIELGKLDEALKYCNLMLTEEVKLKLYQNIAFVWGTLRKSMVLHLMDKPQQALALVEENEKELTSLLNTKNQAPGERSLRAFYIIKSIVLFINKKYRECWIYLNSVLPSLSQNKSNVPDLEILQLMIQYELMNFDLLKKMSDVALKKIKKTGRINYAYEQILNFFSQVKPENAGILLPQVKSNIVAYYEKAGINAPKCFGILSYVGWLNGKIK